MRFGGFTLVEILVVLITIAIVLSVAVVNLLQARRTAQDRPALLYAENVYKVAVAYLTSERISLADLPLECSQGYRLGGSEAPNPGSVVQSCQILVNPEQTRLQVEVVASTGRTIVIPESP